MTITHRHRNPRRLTYKLGVLCAGFPAQAVIEGCRMEIAWQPVCQLFENMQQRQRIGSPRYRNNDPRPRFDELMLSNGRKDRFRKHNYSTFTILNTRDYSTHSCQFYCRQAFVCYNARRKLRRLSGEFRLEESCVLSPLDYFF